MVSNKALDGTETHATSQEIEAIKGQIPDDIEIMALTETFKILGDPNRLRIVIAMTKKEMCVYDLGVLIGVSASAISHQLRLLRSMQLVKYRKEGKTVFYSLDDEHIENLIQEAQKHVRESLIEKKRI